MAQKMMKGKFDLEDMLAQLRQIQKLGSMGSLIGMIPGLSRFKTRLNRPASATVWSKSRKR